MKGVRYEVRSTRKPDGSRRTADEAKTSTLVFALYADERWPIRGLDPILHVGSLAIDAYQYGNADNTLLLFTCWDASQLEEGAEAFVQYGGDVDSRTDLRPFRWGMVN
jgi:hypothetical protein